MPVDLSYGAILDSRDLIERLNELESMVELDEDETTELEELRAAADAGIPDWDYGEALIREDYFEEYAQELAEDVGAIDRNASWPLTYIDWAAAAAALLQDYTEVQLQGFIYYARA